MSSPDTGGSARNGLRIVVFLGPTMPVADAKALLPGATFLPPARQGDVLSAVRNRRPDVIALIDGVFHQSLSVWHKEILYALSTGVHVYGSSSMGALRGAECAAFGMRGIGRVYEAFADGTLTEDDEVALAHGDADSGYQPFSLPMVNVRGTLAAARAAGILSEAHEQTVIGAGKSLYFPDRHWPSIAAAAQESGLPAAAGAALVEFGRARYVDQKRLDAEQLLRTLRELPADLAPPPPVTVNRSHVFEALWDRDRRVERAAGEVSLEEISRHVMLHRADSAAVMEQALGRELVAVLGDLLKVEVDDAATATELERFRARHRLTSDADLAAYLERNDLAEEELTELMRREAVARRLRAWLTVRRYKLGLVRPLLDELRLADDYAGWADAAAAREMLLSEVAPRSELLELDNADVADLLRAHARATGWRPDTTLATWSEEAGFAQAYDVLIEMKRTQLCSGAGVPAQAVPDEGAA